ncbi:MAG: flagellar protein FliT [Gammaproteobacteria bacterium]|nr:flagellar protein FliT [Gammaproteobacteria bacterium]
MQYKDQLNNAVSVTSKMLDAAKEGDWEGVIQLEEKRQISLSLMKKMTPASVETGVIDKLQALIVLNNELMELSVVEKAVCFSHFSTNQKSKKAFQAYGSR